MKSQIVLIEDTKYTLDVDRAIELGILKTLTRKLKFSDIKVGETFCFITSNFKGNFKGIYVKTDNYADALYGLYGSSSPIDMSTCTCEVGQILDECRFDLNNSEVKVYRNGKYVTEVPLDK